MNMKKTKNEKTVMSLSAKQVETVADPWFLNNLPPERTNVFGLCIHHTDTDDINAARRALARQGFSTHFLIDKDGTIYKEMPLADRAAACVGFNRWMLQLDVVGRLHLNEPTPEQMTTLRTTIQELACGRTIERIDQNFAKECRRQFAEDLQKVTTKKYQSTYKKLYKEVRETKDWISALSKLPFIVMYHGEVRPTACCGKYLINKFQQLVE